MQRPSSGNLRWGSRDNTPNKEGLSSRDSTPNKEGSSRDNTPFKEPRWRTPQKSDGDRDNGDRDRDGDDRRNRDRDDRRDRDRDDRRDRDRNDDRDRRDRDRRDDDRDRRDRRDRDDRRNDRDDRDRRDKDRDDRHSEKNETKKEATPAKELSEREKEILLEYEKQATSNPYGYSAYVFHHLYILFLNSYFIHFSFLIHFTNSVYKSKSKEQVSAPAPSSSTTYSTSSSTYSSRVAPAPAPVTTESGLTENKLAALIMKAKMKGDKETMNKLQDQLDQLQQAKGYKIIIIY